MELIDPETEKIKLANKAKKVYELKEKAAKYYSENGVPKKMEAILNSMFYDNPKDVFGHLSNYFETLAMSPTIKRFEAREIFDANGQPTIQTKVFCTVKNNEKLLACSTSCMETPAMLPVPTPAKGEGSEASVERTALAVAVTYINTTLTETFTSRSPTNQNEADGLLDDFMVDLETRQRAEEEEARQVAGDPEGKPSDGKTATPDVHKPASPDRKSGKKSAGKKGKGGPVIVLVRAETRETWPLGAVAVCAVSQALCEAAAAVLATPLYLHLASFCHKQVKTSLKMPIPLVTILAGGKWAHGKQRCIAEYMVLPPPDASLRHSIPLIRAIYEYCANSLTAKGMSGRLTNPSGALCPPHDRPEQGIELLQEAIAAVAPEQAFRIALNCATLDSLDLDRGRYEVVAGQQKSPDDLADFWAELITKHPSVVMVIDPMRKQEYEAWMRLCDRSSGQCFVCADRVLQSPGYLGRQPPPPPPPQWGYSAAVLRLEHCTTLTDVMRAADALRKADVDLILSTSAAETNGTFVADLAVGLQAEFFKVGSACRGEHVAKLNRLVDVERELEASGALEARPEQLKFPEICLPPGDQQENSSTPSTPSKKK